jgi:hypothetical protein
MSARVVLTTCLMAGLVLFGAGPTQAQSGYRYWSFWQVENNQWRYSQIGPASLPVTDGDVHGWRFGVSTQDGSAAPQPRTDPTQAFESICGAVAVDAGEVRVAILVDSGQQDIAPPGQQAPAPRPACAVVPQGSTGATALSAVAELGINDGFICSINGYPSGECAVAVDVPSAVPGEQADVLLNADEPANAIEESPAPTNSGDNPVPLIIGGAVIFAGLIAAWFLQRRRT